MPYAFSQSERPFSQCKHFSQIKPFEKSWFLVMFVYFNLIQWDLCFVGINVIMG